MNTNDFPLIAGYLFFALCLSIIYLILYEKKKKEKEMKISKLEKMIQKKDAEIEQLHNKTFREKDLVYTNNKNFHLNEPYFIIKIYGGLGGQCAIIHKDRNADPERSWSCMQYGVPLKNLQHEQFPKCPTCNQNLL